MPIKTKHSTVGYIASIVDAKPYSLFFTNVDAGVSFQLENSLVKGAFPIFPIYVVDQTYDKVVF